MPMKSFALLVALLLWSSSVLAHPRITVTPEEEQNVNHYVQVLQNMLLSVPTKELSREKKSKSPNNVYFTGSQIPKFKEIITHGEPSNEHDVLTSPITEEPTTIPNGGFTPEIRKRHTKSTAFWSIKPNNVSVVLRVKEPYIEKEEPDLDAKETEAPKVLPYVTDSVTDSSMTSGVTSDKTAVSSSNESNEADDFTDGEDVPQLSSGSQKNFYESTTEQQPYTSKYEEILKKISEMRSQVQQVPPSDNQNPEYKEDIKASREHLRRSLALAVAAEHKLNKLYKSQLMPLERSGIEGDNIETVINMLYNSRSKLYEYLNIKYVPPALKRKVIKVVSILKKYYVYVEEKLKSLLGSY